MIVVLQRGLPRYKRYKTYKSALRQDFRYTCGYCLMHERQLGGSSTFAVEHYKPRKEFPDLELEYTNLRYACLLCNSHKGERWPSEDDFAAGRYFLDPCSHDVSLLYRFDSEGLVHGRTVPACYTIEQLNLNRRQLIGKRREMLEEVTFVLGVFHDIAVREHQLLGDDSEPASVERANLTSRRDQAAKILRRLLHPEPID